MNRVARSHHALFSAVAIGGAVLDLGTKSLAFAIVGEPPGRVPVWSGVFSFTTSYNHGALWGLGSRVPFANVVFAGLSVAAALAILYWLFGHGAARDRFLCFALGFIMAGTVGNCFDRIVFGKVRDFLYFELIDWPIFNLADSCLVVGACFLMLQAFFSELPAGQPAATPAGALTSTPDSPNQ